MYAFFVIGLLLTTQLQSFSSEVAARLKIMPEVPGSYRAVGEIVENFPDSGGLIVQMMFEENYDAATKNSAFRIWELGTNITFLEDNGANQSFSILNDQTCAEITVDDWIKVNSPPSLLKYETTNGAVRFSLKQLFSLNRKYLNESEVSTTYRGIDAKKYMYEIRGIENGTEVIVSIYAYWSDPASSWNLTSNKASVPLGYTIDKMELKQGESGLKLHEQFINVHAFFFDSINQKEFAPRQGIVCPNRKETFKFPNIKNLPAVSFHSEVVLPDYQEVKSVDTWYDPKNKMLRVDMDKIKDQTVDPLEKGQRYLSEMISGNLGAVFKSTWYAGVLKCSVNKLSEYDFDVQDLINPKLPLTEWSVQKAFGLNVTKYVYIGKTVKRNIPCHLFQGLRKDWPESSSGVTSLWEWCFAVPLTEEDEVMNFRDGELPLVNVQINITESTNDDYSVGFRLIHHFYDVMAEDPDTMDATKFDVRYCYKGSNTKALQFTIKVSITKDNRDAFENATSDVSFLQKWKSTIAASSELPLSSMRVTQMESTLDGDKLLVKFYLLGVHPDLPDDVKSKQKSLADAVKSLGEAIDGKKLSIKYKLTKDAEMTDLFAEENTLVDQINKKFEHNTTIEPPIPIGSTETTRLFTLITEPSVKPQLRVVTSGHQPGTIAAVSVVMLLVGITLGSAGTFVKYNGLPSCLRSGATA